MRLLLLRLVVAASVAFGIGVPGGLAGAEAAGATLAIGGHSKGSTSAPELSGMTRTVWAVPCSSGSAPPGGALSGSPPYERSARHAYGDGTTFACPRVAASSVDVRDILLDSAADGDQACRTFSGRSEQTVAPSGLADDGARFVVDSAGSTTLRAKGPQAWIDVSEHAARRMTQRGISIHAVDNALMTQPFNYFHDGVWKVGYYDPVSRVFVGTVNGNATTVIKTGPNYINNLKAAQP